MKRPQIRTMKRALRAGFRSDASSPERQLGRDCALALLTRSITMGHERLAVLRLAIAVDAGARVPLDQWAYCARIARTCGEARLKDIYRSAVDKFARISLPVDQYVVREEARND